MQNPHSGHYQPATPIVSFDTFPFLDSRTHTPIQIIHQPGTIVVNAGDLLARWSNDTFRSTLHRVVAPRTKINDRQEMTPARQSIAFFCNPNGYAEIACLPNCHGTERPPKYKPVTTEDYIVGRLSDTYT